MAVNFISILKAVLDKNINVLAASEGITREEVYNRIVWEAERNQAEWYSNKVPELNYARPECRLAYLYIVAAVNTNTFKYILNHSTDLKDFVLQAANERHELKVCAFGAGPGTELLAFAKFFSEEELGHAVSVDFHLLDKVNEWASSWYAIREEINQTFRSEFGNNRAAWPLIPSGNLVACDVTDVERISGLGNVWNQDIYVFNFILSEIFDDNPGFRSFIKTVASLAPSGSKFVFIERRGGMWETRITNVANEASLSLSSFTEIRNSLDGDEQVEDFGEIYSELSERGRQPRTTYNVVYNIATKE